MASDSARPHSIASPLSNRFKRPKSEFFIFYNLGFLRFLLASNMHFVQMRMYGEFIGNGDSLGPDILQGILVHSSIPAGNDLFVDLAHSGPFTPEIRPFVKIGFDKILKEFYILCLPNWGIGFDLVKIFLAQLSMVVKDFSLKIRYNFELFKRTIFLIPTFSV